MGVALNGRTHAPLWAYDKIAEGAIGKQQAAQRGRPVEQYETHVERQGRLFAVARKRRADAPPLQTTIQQGRKVIKRFSKASSRRMLKKIARLRTEQYYAHFVTLTYPCDMRDAQRAKQHLRAFYKRIDYYYPGASLLWRMEFQSRGAIHFHCILFNVKYVKYNEPENPKALQQMWGSVAGHTDQNSLDASRIKSHRGVMHYVAKYVAKREENGFISVPYLAKAVLSLAGKLDAHRLVVLVFLLQQLPSVAEPGRFWGVLGEKNMPYGELVYTVVATKYGTTAHNNIKRAARRVTRGRLRMSSKRDSGVVLFTDNAELWGRYATTLLENELRC